MNAKNGDKKFKKIKQTQMKRRIKVTKCYQMTQKISSKLGKIHAFHHMSAGKSGAHPVGNPGASVR
ncbi:MAG: hypothetical protein MJ077_01905 [Oscillospiraceae bacterium]|nr:hypothetical protein [Oscillospiraceae bacterium]